MGCPESRGIKHHAPAHLTISCAPTQQPATQQQFPWFVRGRVLLPRFVKEKVCYLRGTRPTLSLASEYEKRQPVVLSAKGHDTSRRSARTPNRSVRCVASLWRSPPSMNQRSRSVWSRGHARNWSQAGDSYASILPHFIGRFPFLQFPAGFLTTSPWLTSRYFPPALRRLSRS